MTTLFCIYIITTLLHGLGFEEDEVKTYLLLLELGPLNAGMLAKRTGIVRSSLYGFLDRLTERGLVSQSLKNNVKVFSAQPPEKISLLFNNRIEDLQKKEELFRQLLPDLHVYQSSKLIRPRLQIFEGKEGLQNLVKDVFLYRDMETQSFWPIKRMIEILTPDFFRFMNKQRIRNNLFVRAIWPESQKVDTKEYPFLGDGEQFKREFRIAPPNTDFSMGYWIYGRKVAFISSLKESFGFIIESTEFAEMLLAQFNLIWNISSRLETNPKDSEVFLKELERY